MNKTTLPRFYSQQTCYQIQLAALATGGCAVLVVLGLLGWVFFQGVGVISLFNFLISLAGALLTLKTGFFIAEHFAPLDDKEWPSLVDALEQLNTPEITQAFQTAITQSNVVNRAHYQAVATALARVNAAQGKQAAMRSITQL